MSRRHRRYHRPQEPLVASIGMPRIELPRIELPRIELPRIALSKRFALSKLGMGRASAPALTVASAVAAVALLIAQVSPVIHRDAAQRADTVISAAVAAPTSFDGSATSRLEGEGAEMTVEASPQTTPSETPSEESGPPTPAAAARGSAAIPITTLPASPTAGPVRAAPAPGPTAPSAVTGDGATASGTSSSSTSTSSTSGSSGGSTSTPPPSTAPALPIDTGALPSAPPLPLPSVTTPPSPLDTGGL